VVAFKFKVREAYWPLKWGRLVIKYWPAGPANDGWSQENIEREEQIIAFISAAIQEKQERGGTGGT
jgi:hypothetical protein